MCPLSRELLSDCVLTSLVSETTRESECMREREEREGEGGREGGREGRREGRRDGVIVIPMELRVLASVRYLTSWKYADASEVTVTETDHTEQGHEICLC